MSPVAGLELDEEEMLLKAIAMSLEKEAEEEEEQEQLCSVKGELLKKVTRQENRIKLQSRKISQIFR